MKEKAMNNTFIVADIGGNIKQSKERGMKLIKAAADAGADAIKLQTYKPEDFVAPGVHTIPDGLWKGMDMHELYRRSQLPWEWHGELFEYAKKLELEAFSTPFSLEAVDFLEELNCPRYKIASLEIGYLPLIKACAKTRKPIIISTGAITKREDILCALSTVYDACPINLANITLLKCVAKYPTLVEESNLATLILMDGDFSAEIGLSDHTTSTVIPAFAVMAGATMIEKHLDLDDKLGIDAAFSLNPGEFYDMVNNIRLAEKAIGTSSYVAPAETSKYRRRFDPKSGKWLRYIPEEKPTETEEIAMEAVESSNIKGAGYNIGQNILYIEFHGGGVYSYYEVPKEVFEGLISSESVGKFFHKSIKGKYKFEKKA